MEFRKLSQLISNNAEMYPDKECLFYKDRSYTYSRMEELVRHTAGVLQSNGVKKGDRVGILLENCPEFILSYFGVLRLGAVAVPTNIFLKDREIAANMNDCAAEYLISSETFADRMKSMPELAHTLKKTFTHNKASFESIVINEQIGDAGAVETYVEPKDLAIVLYTSGTTGRSKGVMLTHSNIIENAKSYVDAIGMAHGDRMMMVLPMFHATSMLCSLLGPLVRGSSIVLLESILEVSRSGYPEMLKKLRPSLVVGVPAFFSTLARAKVTDEMRESFPFRLCISGGAPLPVDIINRFKDVYGKMILEGYGLSEASPVVSVNPLSRQKPGTIGVAIPRVEVRIVDEQQQDLPRNTPGELIVRGPNVMTGYWNQPEETAKAIRNGWLHTGDVATMDEEGFITIVDRIKDLILVKGMNVYPREIEELLYKYRGVLLASVVSIPDGEGSEIPVAYIKADPEAKLTVEELKDYLRHNMAGFKVPRKFKFTDDIPVNAGGKIVKKELRTRALTDFQ